VTDRTLPTAPSAPEEWLSGLSGGDVPHLALTDLVPCVVWTARPDGWIDYANRFWFRFTELTPEQTYGWGWQAALHPEDLPRVMDGWTRAAAGDRSRAAVLTQPRCRRR
jgi:PAS domain-containing protein